MSRISLDLEEAVAVLRINDPTTRNALSKDTLNELCDAIETVEASRRFSSVVISGTNGVFAAGANINELASLSPDAALEFGKTGQKIFSRIHNSQKLYIAAIDGYCMGGGLDLALSCRIRYSSSSSSFAHPGTRLGIITGWGGTQLLPSLIGHSAALELLLTGRTVKAAEALNLGMISRIDADPTALAIETGSRWSQRPSLSL